MELLLEGLNRQRVRQFGDEAPEDLSDVMDEETYDKSNRYTLTKSRFSSVQLCVDGVVLAAVLLAIAACYLQLVV